MNMSLIKKHLSVAVSVLLISLGAGAQNISLSFSGAPLADVLHAMEEQTDCSFIYETADLNKVSSITIDAKNSRFCFLRYAASFPHLRFLPSELPPRTYEYPQRFRQRKALPN